MAQNAATPAMGAQRQRGCFEIQVTVAAISANPAATAARRQEKGSVRVG